MTEWPFSDPPNVAVFVLKRILDGTMPILRVCHDDDDGGWQFLDGGPATNDQAMLVSLRHMLNHDPSIAELADLPCGWDATRTGPGNPWRRVRSESVE